MKKLLPFLLLTLICIQTTSYSQSPVIQTIINQTNLDSLIYFVRELSGDVETIIGGSPYTIVSRHKYQPANDKAADYIKQKLNSYGLATYDQWWSGTGRNVYGVQVGSVYPNKKYIICAHYDDMPSGLIAPGADDNGSGTAAVLEAARILTQYNADYTIVYALWDEEEQGLVGSAYYAQQAALAGDSIMGVLNMDMIAYDSDNDNVGEIHVRDFGNSLSLKDKMVEVNTTYNIGVTPSIINPGTTASDQSSFWNNGFGAILLIEEYYGGDFNAYYHTTNDLITHFNQPYYLKMSQLVYGTAATLAEVTETVPVELASFSGTQKGNSVQLEWSTASETNNYGFEVQRSIADYGFQTIAFIEGVGTTTETSFYSYLDNSALNNSVLRYRLKQVDYDGTFSYSKTVNIDVVIPQEFVLNQNYPNPFNPSTIIEYSIPKDGLVNLVVYNLMGEEIAVLENMVKSAGTYKYNFNARELPSGVYFYSLVTENKIISRKMTLVK